MKLKTTTQLFPNLSKLDSRMELAEREIRYYNLFINKLSSLLVLLFFSYLPSFYSQTETFSTAGTYSWVCPLGVTSVTVHAWGGGGAGGGINITGVQRAGGGGGGGAYSSGVVSVTPGNTYTIVVGAGGTGVSAGNGNSGNNSTFNSTSIVAAGGAGGTAHTAASSTAMAGGAGGLTSACTGTTKWAGGSGGPSSSSGLLSGSGGGSAGSSSIGGDATTSSALASTTAGSAGTGTYSGGNGATGLTSGNSAGTNCTNLAGGGSGARASSTSTTTPRSGGSGGAGKVILTYVCGNTYATLPYTNDFQSAWIDQCNNASNTNRIPDQYWRASYDNNTGTADNNCYWHASDYTGSEWNTPTSGLYSPAGANSSSKSARFHNRFAPSGTYGYLDLCVNLSSGGILSFDYIFTQTSGASNLTVLLSTDGGVTFPTTIATIANNQTSWVNKGPYTLSTTSSTCVIRFRGLSNYGANDLGIDNVSVTSNSSTLTLTNATTAVSSANICASSSAVPIHAFNITGSNGGGTLTNFSFTTTGSYLAADITNFKILYNTSNTMSGATTLATLSSPGAAGSKTFTAFSQAIGNATGYFWITMDVASGATNGGTITVSASASTDMTTTVTKAGSAIASGAQTLKSTPTSSAGSAQTVCSTATLAATNPTIGTGVWSLVSGTGTITTSSAYNSGLTGLGVGANVFRWTVSNSPCASSTSDVTITANATPSAPSASAQSFCSSSSTTVANLQATGTSIQWYAAASGGSALAPSTALANSTTYYATQTVGSCESASRTSAVVTITSPIVITASPSTTPVSTCINGTAFSPLSLTATGTSPSYQWYSNTTSSTSGGTTVGTNSNSYTPVNTSAGTLYYYCIVSSGTPCSSSVTSSVSGAVTVNSLPANPSNPTSDSPQCASPGVTLTSSGSAPVGETWYWQTTTTGTSTSSSASTTYNTSTAGTYYIRSKTTSSGCWSSGYGSATISINSVPATVTLSSPSSAATGVSLTPTLSWVAVSGATSYDVYIGTTLPGSPTANVSTNSYSPSTLLGSTSYSWKVVAKNACGAGTSSSTRLFTTLIANDACANATSISCATSSLSGTTIGTVVETTPTSTVSGYGVWYKFTGDGSSVTLSSYSSDFDLQMDVFSGSCGSLTLISETDDYIEGYDETYTFNSVNTTSYYVYIAYWDSYGTSSDVGAFTISMTTAPTSPSAITGLSSICASSTGNTYSVTNVSGNTYNWTLPSGWVQTAGGTSNSINVTGGTSSGTISVTATNTCGTSSASSQLVSVTAMPTATASNGGSYCTGNSIQLTGGGSGYTSYTWSGPNSYSASGAVPTGISENFDGTVTGWSLSGVTVAATQNCSGANTLSYSGTGQFAITPAITNPNILNCNIKRSTNTTAWSVEVQISSASPTSQTSGPWTTVTTIGSSVLNTCSAITAIDLSSYTGLRYVRFIDTRSSGTAVRGIDDVIITASASGTISPAISGATASMSGVYTLTTTNSGCSTTATTTVTVNNPSIPVGFTVAANDVVWTGATSGEYSLASNWLAYDGASYSVPNLAPSTASNIIIPATGICLINNPSSASTINAKDVKIAGVLTLNSGSILNVSGDWINNGTLTANSVSSVVFNGSSAQTISGSNNSTFNNLTLNNSAGLTVSKGITVNNVLTFTAGNITAASSSEAVTFETSATASGAADTRCIVGYCKKNTNSTTRFIFPVGTSTLYRSAAITPSGTSATTWTAKYYGAGYGTYTVTGGSIYEPSKQEYWTIDRSGVSASAATVELSWGSNSHVYAPNTSDLIVAHFTGTAWENAGGNVNTSTGFVSSSAGWSSFSPFTLGSQQYGVTLPIILVSFDVKPYQKDVKVSWQTASEIENDYFTVERSENGVDFQQIARVDGAGNSSHTINYFTMDTEFNRTVLYYRLKLTSFNGEETYSTIASVDMSQTQNQGVIIMTVNSIGQEVNETAKGIVFDIYSDGTSVKRIQF